MQFAIGKIHFSALFKEIFMTPITGNCKKGYVLGENGAFGGALWFSMLLPGEHPSLLGLGPGRRFAFRLRLVCCEHSFQFGNHLFAFFIGLPPLAAWNWTQPEPTQAAVTETILFLPETHNNSSSTNIKLK